MTERESGLYKLLKKPKIYNLVQRLFKHSPTQERWQGLLNVEPTSIVLDVGCGPGEQAEQFQVARSYTGIDISETYIQEAKSRNQQTNAVFLVANAKSLVNLPNKNYNLVVLKGVFHHLSEDVISDFFENLRPLLARDAQIYSMDPVITHGNWARPSDGVVRLDRGRHLRSQKALIETLPRWINVDTSEEIPQPFPPYRRLILKLRAMD